MAKKKAKKQTKQTSAFAKAQAKKVADAVKTAAAKLKLGAKKAKKVAKLASLSASLSAKKIKKVARLAKKAAKKSAQKGLKLWGKVKKGWARVELVEVAKILVAARDIEVGTILSREHLVVQRRPREDQGWLSAAPTFLLGSRVVIRREQGDPLHKSDVVMPMPIARGTEVQVVVRRGGVVASTVGILEAKTLVGDSTRVRVAGRLLGGRLVQSDRVELGETKR